MASDKDFMQFVADQIGDDQFAYKSMFGEYGLYFKGKFFAVVCDNMLYVKPTEPGRKLIGEPEEAPPYPGAKNYFLITDLLEDRDTLINLVHITCEALPEPRKKKKS